MPQFQPGQSGNPRGRPKKDRALTDILERAGSKTVDIDGTNVSGRRLLARMVWQGLMTGEVEFPDGKTMRLAPQDWKDFVKWLYGHIDGPPKAELDITSDGKQITWAQFIGKGDDTDTTPDSK
jgi:hypothetical protein